ncbi:MAG: LptA/OstA family protein [Limisphaerales bacterium]
MNLKLLTATTLAVGVAAAGTWLAVAQIPQNVSAKGINLPYFEGTQLKAFFLADAADPAPGGHIFAKQFQMFTFGPGGTNDVEVIIKAPECFFDYDTRRAWSSGSLKAFNSSTNYVIEGEGFVCQRTKTGSTLEISNKVHTTIQREIEGGKVAPPVHIRSDHLFFVSEEVDGPEKRLANYKGNVNVEDPEMLLNCGLLRVAIPAGTNQVRTIVAEHNVKIRNKADNSQATGQFAFYSSHPTNEVVTLSGNPVWKDERNEGRAEQFILDRRNKIVYARTNAELKMPRSEMAAAELMHSGSATPQSTNEFVTVRAEFFEILLPATNRPSRSLLANNKVVISSPADKTRATAKTATFEDATGLLHLRGNATWQTDQTVAKADLLVLNRSNRTFRAENNASLKLPANNSTNQFLTINSEKYLLQTNVANFEGGVRAEFLDGKAPSFLTCATLEVLMRSNQVETILAKGGVRLSQTISQNQSRSLVCDEMTIQRSIVTGSIESLVAERKVSLVETEPKSAKRLVADTVTMGFGRTNQLESLLAESNVKISQGADWASGERAIYISKGEIELFEITGQPIARKTQESSDGRISSYLIKQANVLRWDPKTGEFSSEGPVEIEPENLTQAN